jgi:hypothetical protein
MPNTCSGYGTQKSEVLRVVLWTVESRNVVLSSGWSTLSQPQQPERNLVATNLFATRPSSCIAKAGQEEKE